MSAETKEDPEATLEEADADIRTPFSKLVVDQTPIEGEEDTRTEGAEADPSKRIVALETSRRGDALAAGREVTSRETAPTTDPGPEAEEGTSETSTEGAATTEEET